MAQKRITELQLRDNVTDEVNLPSDDGVQSYRVTALQIKNYILSAGSVLRSMLTEAERIPTGSVQAYVASTAPTGWLVCNGSAISRTTYADLFAIIGTQFGSGDGSTTFHLPDLRGRFVRGWANGSGNDPDRASRTAQASGGATGDNIGSLQGHAFQTHLHNAGTYGAASGGAHQHTALRGSGSGSSRFVSAESAFSTQANDLTTTNISSGGAHTHSVTGNSGSQNASGTNAQSSANETRPLNLYMNYIIKF